jgi:hypothetical protein
MGKIRATKVATDPLAEEHQQLVNEMRELSRELRDCIEEVQRALFFTTKLEGWSKADPVN